MFKYSGREGKCYESALACFRIDKNNYEDRISTFCHLKDQRAFHHISQSNWATIWIPDYGMVADAIF